MQSIYHIIIIVIISNFMIIIIPFIVLLLLPLLAWAFSLLLKFQHWQCVAAVVTVAGEQTGLWRVTLNAGRGNVSLSCG